MLEVLKNRRSARSYLDKPVEEEKINEVINAGLYAASGMNYQYGIIIAITNKEVRDKLSKLNAKIMNNLNIDPFYGAPVVLLVACKKWRNSPYDGSCMIENMMIEACSQGLGTCWIHRAKEELEMDEGKEILKDLGINLDEYEGVGHVILGYPKEEPKVKEIKENRVFYIK